MKLRCYSFVVMIFIVVFSSTSIFGQQTYSYKTGDPADWPKNQDAVVAAPKNHKILLENEKVRVLEVTVAPGEVEPIHHHQWPSVLYVMEAGFLSIEMQKEMLLLIVEKFQNHLLFL